MRKRIEQGGVVVQAVTGNHAVFFGFDLAAEARTGCLGFALHREDHTEGEAYWIPGFKTFRSVVPQPSATTIYTTDKHPIQGMWWGDYSAKPAHDYTYKIIPVYGTPASPVVDDARSVTLDVSTSDPATGKHGIYFNRGVAASQAYATKFGAAPPALPPAKQAEAMTWLSRGLHEALCGFITTAASPQLVVRAAAYEFTEPTVLAAFAQAHAAGADVKIIYHDKPNDPQSALNDQAISAAQLDPGMLIARHHPTIAHNKFIVRATRAGDGTLSGEQVWTGSTNMSQGGIFGHSNVGHAVRDPDIARAYLGYWAELSGDPTAKPLKTWVSANSTFDGAAEATAGIHTLFSPRLDLQPLDWYATGFTGSTATAHITLPFGMDAKHFEPAVAAMAAGGPLRFVMLNTQDDHQDTWSRDQAIQVAVGAEGGPDVLSRWAKETLTGFNGHVDYLHTKILLIGALWETPTIISGSANFSEASTTSNDENMLVIAGDRDVADVYFTEYMRIFQHFYARWWAAKLGAAGTDSHSFLTEDDSWQARYWTTGPRSWERDLYAHQVGGNG
ncbi:MAG TPA: phospholipase D-like domain-containing protein [Streptosporangiaceae bacterium]|nr:phospholipase D-like domain-containing protein [Streptosporangiaceae bacterium]